MQDVLLLVIGFLVLAISARWLVDGALIIGRRLRWSHIFTGLTLVAAGTSLPELSVNVFASLRGLSGITTGNIFGSNVANILLVLGAAAALRPIAVRKTTVRVGLPLVALSTLIVMAFARWGYQNAAAWIGITRLEGALLLLGFPLYLFHEFATGARPRAERVYSWRDGLLLAVLAIVAGSVGLAASAALIVNAAQSISAVFGLTQELVGVSLLAVGTSLPELATTLVAARQHRHELMVGSVVGSNIFNTLFILGVSALLSPVTFSFASYQDAAFSAAAGLLLWAFLAPARRPLLRRWHGAIMLLGYASFLAYVSFRG